SQQNNSGSTLRFDGFTVGIQERVIAGVFDRGEIVLIGLADQKAPPAIVSRVQRFRYHGLNRQDCRAAFPFVPRFLLRTVFFECNRRCPWDLHWVAKIWCRAVIREFFFFQPTRWAVHSQDTVAWPASACL